MRTDLTVPSTNFSLLAAEQWYGDYASGKGLLR